MFRRKNKMFSGKSVENQHVGSGWQKNTPKKDYSILLCISFKIYSLEHVLYNKFQILYSKCCCCCTFDPYIFIKKKFHIQFHLIQNPRQFMGTNGK